MNKPSLLSATMFLAVTCGILGPACAGPTQVPHERRESRKELQRRLSAFEKPGLLIGEFALANNAVIDGDTVHVEGLGTSLRLLAIDTEETFKHETERRAFEQGFETYVRNMRGNSPRPVKYATPLGEEATKWAEAFFAGMRTVRLERDHPKEVRDYYNRYLAYIIVTRDGKELNYNVECVRSGMSPYFSKYGYSRRFHEQFVAAEAEARAARRGIWDPDKQHYPDYDERKEWWDARAEFIQAFEDEAARHDNYIILTNYDAPQRLEAFVDKEVIVLGAVGDVRISDGNGPTRVMLSRRRSADFPLIFWDRDVFMSSGIGRRVGEYVRVKGFVTKYEDRRGRRYQLQIKIDLPSQITAAVERDGAPR
jgi:endonuclease YncB( thermonuclease family)